MRKISIKKAAVQRRRKEEEQTSCAEEEKGRGTDIQCRGGERTRTEKVQLILNFKVFFFCLTQTDAIDRPETGNAGKVATDGLFEKRRDRTTVNQSNLTSVSKATSGKLLKGGGRIWAFTSVKCQFTVLTEQS